MPKVHRRLRSRNTTLPMVPSPDKILDSHQHSALDFRPSQHHIKSLPSISASSTSSIAASWINEYYPDVTTAFLTSDYAVGCTAREEQKSDSVPDTTCDRTRLNQFLKTPLKSKLTRSVGLSSLVDFLSRSASFPSLSNPAITTTICNTSTTTATTISEDHGWANSVSSESRVRSSSDTLVYVKRQAVASSNTSTDDPLTFSPTSPWGQYVDVFPSEPSTEDDHDLLHVPLYSLFGDRRQSSPLILAKFRSVPYSLESPRKRRRNSNRYHWNHPPVKPRSSYYPTSNSTTRREASHTSRTTPAEGSISCDTVMYPAVAVVSAMQRSPSSDAIAAALHRLQM